MHEGAGSMSGKKTAYDIVMDRLAEAEEEREVLLYSDYKASDEQRGHNKGMRKAYNILKEDLEREGLASSHTNIGTSDNM